MPTEGMAIMLSGMNTALTTTATAITCFFIYSYFYGKLTDVQTHVFSVVEKTVLIHIIPRFAFDTETVNHQTAQLIGELKAWTFTKDILSRYDYYFQEKAGAPAEEPHAGHTGPAEPSQ
ncbi:MAG: hypothetical protein M0T82_05320 [Desulfobacteraceae bacterium]|nr:hypothetical protein [Desulfobacteraceae bacterium]